MGGMAPAAFGFTYAPSAWLFFFAVSWIMAWGTYWSLRLVRPMPDVPWSRLLGVTLVLWPFVHLTYDVVLDLALVFDRSSVLQPVPADVWWLVIRRRLWQYILVPLLGLYLAFGHHLPAIGHVPLRRRLRDTLRRVDTWPRHGWTIDIMHGLWLFVAVLVFYILLGLALSPITSRLETGDESAVFQNVTPALALALAIIAGTTEEFLFRGIVQSRLRLVMPTTLAVLLQAIGFGLIHAGYGTWSHIVVPMLLGLVLGGLAVRFGVIPIIIVHIGIDLVLFLVTAGANGYPVAGAIGVALIPAALLPPFLYFGLRWMRKRQDGPPPQGPEPTWHNA